MLEKSRFVGISQGYIGFQKESNNLQTRPFYIIFTYICDDHELDAGYAKEFKNYALDTFQKTNLTSVFLNCDRYGRLFDRKNT